MNTDKKYNETQLVTTATIKRFEQRFAPTLTTEKLELKRFIIKLI